MTEKDEFIYAETKKAARSLERKQLDKAIRESLDIAQKKGEHDSTYASSYKLPQETLKANPDLPWSLTSPKNYEMERKVYAAKKSIPLKRVCYIVQGVTPGGGCLDVFLVRGSSVKDLESGCLRPAVEAADIKTWFAENCNKWLIYPYDDAGRRLNFGNLDLDISQEKAESEIDKWIVSGAISYPKTAKYLVSHFSRLSQRIFEKKRLSDFGKRWYEYHRPRDVNLLCKSPKIVTRRMTRDVEFSIDLKGLLPTDGCIAIVLRQRNLIAESLRSLGVKPGDCMEVAYFYILALLNSVIIKFLLKSSADFWQGNYYQVQEKFLSRIPVRLPSKNCIKKIIDIVNLAKEIETGGSRINEIETLMLEIYKLESLKPEIETFLSRHK